MSEQNDSQDIGPQEEEEGVEFNRGSSLSVFSSDRREDFTALLFALAVALFVYLMY